MTNYTQNQLADSDYADSRGGFVRILIIFICICLALAVFFFDQDDMNFFAGGIKEGIYPKNPLGKWGAYSAWYTMLAFGLAAPATVALAFICTLRRLIFNKFVRRAGIDYFAAIVLFTISLSVLLATLPDQFADISSKFNLATMPGGVIGQRLGNPESGLLHITLNTTGTTILAVVCLFGALLYLWCCDWHLLFKHCIGILKKHESKRTKDTDNNLNEKQPIPPAIVAPQEIAEPRQPIALPPPTPSPQAKTVEIKDETPVETTTPITSAPLAAVANGDYTLPSSDLLDIVETTAQSSASAKEIQLNEELLQQTLDSFGIEAKVMSSVSGPQVTLIRISMAPGVKVDKISSLENNIMMTLKATSLRILAPIPGENCVGVEVPNKVLKPVSIRSLIEDPQWLKTQHTLPLLLGKNIAGKTIIIDLAKAPHLLIAGATGSGKSVCMNIIIMSLLYKYSPDQLKLIMVDPKKVEFAAYQKLPHLLTPVIFDTDKVALALKWAVREMERRLVILQTAGCLNLISFNSRPIVPGHPVLLDPDGNPIPDRLPYIVVIIDELADIMATAKNDVETSLARLAAKARAAGIHVIIATQRPDVKVITGTIKSNFPVRIAFRVASTTDSMTILGGKGAESLLGKGDMLYKTGGIGMERIQGAMAQDEERNRVVDFISEQLPQSFEENMFTVVEDSENGGSGGENGGISDADDSSDSSEDLYERAKHIVLSERKSSISYLQRRLGVGFNRAALLMEQLEKNGIVSKPDASNRNSREILVTTEDNGSSEDTNGQDF